MFDRATEEFSRVLHEIGLATKRTNLDVNKTNLVDIQGSTRYISINAETRTGGRMSLHMTSPEMS